MTTHLFRPQRGGFAESMREARPFDGTRAGLEEIVGPVGSAEPYEFDPRNDWDTHIVVTDHGVAGFTNGPVQGVTR